MKQEKMLIENIPAILWGDSSEKVYLYVHGKMANKECAEAFAKVATEKGYQVLSFDLPDHGARKGQGEECDIFNGMRDLNIISKFVQKRWKELNLFACSIGAYFSLQSFAELPIKNCMFQSPILDMEGLIQNMFVWFGITEEELKEKKEIQTPVDLMSWKYFQYVKEHPIAKWYIPTSILYGSEDNLQSIDQIQQFVKRFDCDLTVSKGSKHPFMEEQDIPVVEKWMRSAIIRP